MKFSDQNLFIDARKAQGLQTGVGDYTSQLLEALENYVDATLLFDAKSDVPEKLISFKNIPLKTSFWHLRALKVTASHNALYFSTESLIVPLLIGKSAVVTVHDITPLTMPQVHTLKNVLLHKILMGPCLRRVGAVIVPTNAVKEDLCQHYGHVNPSKVHVVHEGRKLQTIKGAQDSNSAKSKNVLYVGSIEPRKNVSTLIEAFLEANPGDWKLNLAGRVGWLTEGDKKHFDELIANRNVLYHGYVSEEKLSELYSSAALFCYVSEAEGFGLPVLDALARGLHVIHTDDPALVEVAGGCGKVVRRSNLRFELISSLRAYFSANSTEPVQLNLRGIERSKSFSWTAAAAETARILQNVESDLR